MTTGPSHDNFKTSPYGMTGRWPSMNEIPKALTRPFDGGAALGGAAK